VLLAGLSLPANGSQAQPANATELRRALDEAVAAGDPIRARALIRENQNHLFVIFDDYVQEWIEARRAGDERGERSLRAAEAIADAAHAVFGGTALLEMLASLRAFDEGDCNAWLGARRTMAAGRSAAGRGADDEALELFAIAEEEFDRLGWTQQVAWARLEIGVAWLRRGQPEQALAPLQSACELFGETANPYDREIAHEKLAVALGRLGRAADSDRAFAEALRFAELVSEKEYRWCLVSVGRELCRLGRHDAAREHFARKRELARALGDVQETAAAVRELAACNGHPWPPAIDLRAALDEALDSGDMRGVEALLERYPADSFQVFESYAGEWIEAEGAAPLTRARALASAAKAVFGAGGLNEMAELLPRLDERQRALWREARGALEDARVALEKGDDAGALPPLEESERRFRELGWIPGLARTSLLVARRSEPDDLAVALDRCRAACGHADALGDPLQQSEAYLALGSALLRRGEEVPACGAFDTALAAGARLGSARVLQCLAEVAWRLAGEGRHELARKYLADELELAREVGDRSAVTWGSIDMCATYLAEGRVEECSSWLARFSAPVDELPRAVSAEMDQDVGNAARLAVHAKSDPQAAGWLLHLRCSLALGGAPREEREANLVAAAALAEALDGVFGTDFHRRGVEVLAELDEVQGRQYVEGHLFNSIGLRNLHSPEVGAEWFGKARDVFVRLGCSLQLPQVEHHLGWCLLFAGRHHRSLEAFQHAADLYQEMGAAGHAAHSLTFLGQTLADLGRFEEALEAFRHALDIQEERGDPFEAALCRNSLGTCLTALGQHAQAIGCLQQALSFWRTRAEPHFAPRCLHLLGSAFLAAGEPARALECFEEADVLPYSHQEGDEVKIPMGLGAALDALHRPGEAVRHLDRAVAEAERSGNGIWTAAALDERGAAHRALGQLDIAALDHLRALEIETGIGQHRDAARSLLELARCRAAQGRPAEVLEHLEGCVDRLDAVQRRSLSEEGRRAFLNQWALVPELASQAVVEHAGESSGRAVARGLSIVDRFLARTLLEGMQEKAQGVLETFDPELASERAGTLGEMGDLRLTLAKQDTPEKRAELAAAERRMDELDRRLRAANPALRELVSPSPVDLAGARRALRPSEALLLYVLGEQRSFVWVIDHAQVLVLPLRPEAEIRWSFEALSTALDPTGSRDQGFIEPARELERLLLADARAHLAPHADLVIVPDGFLGFLPFEVLLTRDVPALERAALERLPYLVTEQSVRYVPSASFLVWARSEAVEPSRAPVEMLLVGDPVYAVERAEGPELAMRSLSVLDPERLTRLLATRAEVVSIAESLLGPGDEALRGSLASLPRSSRVSSARFELRLGEEASKSGLVQAPDRYRNLHLAVHGFFDAEYPWFSGLVLSGAEGGACSFLNLVEIASLDLDAELVFLSACDTARGELAQAEGIKNTARSFLLAGARAVVATQWTVSDEASARFAREFYQRLFAGDPTATALRGAKLASIRGAPVDLGPARGIGRFRPERTSAVAPAHPAFWAPFVLWGAW
jgi:tetratricopeptide (TPR) repeat protein